MKTVLLQGLLKEVYELSDIQMIYLATQFTHEEPTLAICEEFNEAIFGGNLEQYDILLIAKKLVLLYKLHEIKYSLDIEIKNDLVGII